MELSDRSFGIANKVLKKKTRSVNRLITPEVRVKAAEIRENYNELKLILKDYSFIIRAYNEGVAYRFESNLKHEIIVKSETANYNFNGNYMCWWSKENSFHSSNQVYYDYKSLMELKSSDLASLPLIVQSTNGTKIAKKAAEHKLLVDFHGSYKPAGLRRMYPNVMTREGVNGGEQYKWSYRQTPEHNLITPFGRMLAGPMDYTPGAMNNAQEKNFKPIFDRPMSMGTRCHQLAMYVCYESPLQMFCDAPSMYYKEPEAMEFLSQVPVVWDETKVLEAKVADYLLIARRNGANWYIGGMTDWSERELEIDFSFLKKDQKYKMIILQDGKNA
ncbi:MAG: glycoside hydrolase family 97 catalytic domain-containing protein, partial [Bacteroidota bacterium]